MSGTHNQPEGAVVIGTSVGAIEALSVVLPSLPREFRWPVLVVVHIPPDKKSTLAALFAGRCELRVKEAEDKEPLEGGTVYFAPPDYHLLVEPDGSLSLSSEEPVLYSRPSINVLFETAADAFGDMLAGVVLTGSNNDGARGLRALCEAGGRAFVQSPDTAEGTAMPLAALEACPEACALPLDRIGPALETFISRS